MRYHRLRLAAVGCLATLFASWALADAPKASSAPPGADCVTFRNQDVCHGEWTGFSLATGMTWRRADADAPFSFATGEVSRVTLLRPLAPAKPGDDDLCVRLACGDLLVGRLVSWTPEVLVLDTRHMGRLTVPGRTVIGMAAGLAAVSCLGEDQDWDIRSTYTGPVRVADGRMTLDNLAACRKIELPKRFRLDVEVAFGSQSLEVGLGSASEDSRGDYCKLSVRADMKYVLFRNEQGQETQEIFAAPKEPITRVSILADSQIGEAALYAQGKRLGLIKVPPKDLAGPFLRVYGSPAVNATGLVVTRLTATPWQGATLGDVLPPLAGDAPSGSGAAADEFEMANGDRISGTLSAIRDGKVFFKSAAAGPLEVPLARIRLIGLARKPDAPTPPGPGEVTLSFHDSGRLRMRPESMAGGKLAGRSAALGACTVQLDSVRQIVFHPEVSAVPPASAAGRAEFMNGDVLHGALAGFSADKGLAWRFAGMAAPVTFSTAGLRRVELVPAAPPPQAKGGTLVLFKNGDTLGGAAVRCMDGRLTMETGHSGRLSFAAATVRGLAPYADETTPLVAGFGEKKDWTVANGRADAVTVADDRLTTSRGASTLETAGTASAVRAMPFPRKFRLELGTHIEDRGWTYVCLLADGKRKKESGYTLSTYAGHMYISGGDGKIIESPDLLGDVRLTFLGDADAKTLAVLVNGKQVAAFTDPDPFPAGKNLVLRGDDGTRIFSRLALYHWNARLAAKERVEAMQDATDQDALLLIGKDLLHGHWLGLRDGKAAFLTAYGPVEVPMERVDAIRLAGPDAAQTGPGSVRVTLADGDRLTLHLESIGNGKLSGRFEALDDGTIALDAVRRMDFHPD